MEGHSEKVMPCKRREPSSEIKLAKTLILDHEKIHVCCLSHPPAVFHQGSPSRPMHNTSLLSLEAGEVAYLICTQVPSKFVIY